MKGGLAGWFVPGHHMLKYLCVASRRDYRPVMVAFIILAMNHEAIVHSIDAEIERLSKARALLTGKVAPSKLGLPQAAPTRKRSTMSPEGRARVAAAQRARWAKVRRAS
jgi:hypothetical protein